VSGGEGKASVGSKLDIVRLALSVLAFPAFAAPAAAQNLLLNPDFDHDNAGWIAIGDGEGHGPDSGGCHASGSMSADSAAILGGEISIVATCLPKPPQATLTFRARYRLDGITARVEVWPMSSADCSELVSPSYQSADFPGTGSWSPIAATVDVPSSPYMRVGIAGISGTGSPHTLEVDRAYLGVAPLLSRDDLETGDSPPCRWDTRFP
jgi:hypothetical protein